LVERAGLLGRPVTALYERSKPCGENCVLVKGAGHIVVKRKYQGDPRYIFQEQGGRIIFADYPMKRSP